MYKHILVPIDLAHAEKGKAMVKAAQKLVDSKGGHITLVNVVDELPGYVAVEIPSDVVRRAADNAKETMESIAHSHGIPESAVKVVRGKPHQAILDLADDIKPDLIIIASHDPGLQDYLIGSTAGRVVRHAHCSVLVTR